MTNWATTSACLHLVADPPKDRLLANRLLRREIGDQTPLRSPGDELGHRSGGAALPRSSRSPVTLTRSSSGAESKRCGSAAAGICYPQASPMPRPFRKNQPVRQIRLDPKPGIFHCTYRCRCARNRVNVYTIHDLVPLRLPFTTLDNKREYSPARKDSAAGRPHRRRCRSIRSATSSNCSASGNRVTNTYQAVHLPDAYRELPSESIAEQLKGCRSRHLREYSGASASAQPRCRRSDRGLWLRVHILLALVAQRKAGDVAETKLIAELRDRQRWGSAVEPPSEAHGPLLR